MVLAVCGYTGQGVETAGDIFIELLRQEGRAYRSWRDFSTIIRGGLTAFEVYLDETAVGEAPARLGSVDVAVVWDDACLARYQPRLGASGRAFGSEKATGVPGPERADCPKIGFNLWALGVLAQRSGIDLTKTLDAARRRFPDEANQEWVRQGYRLAQDTGHGTREVSFSSAADMVSLSGNDALCLGAIMGGVRFYCGYPITPASDILEFFARWLPALGGVTYQVEDEIAAVHMAVGASFAGQRTFVATSGPGLALMTEGMGWAATIEVPLVLVDNQRGGPSTGMPTKTEQSDWLHLHFAGHGEFARIVLAPTSVLDSLTVIQEALNLADYYQCPVLVGLDLDLAVRRIGVRWADVVKHLQGVLRDRGRTLTGGAVLGGYRRYWSDEEGLPPLRTIPGVKDGAYVASGDEHDERGWMEPDFTVVRPTLHRRRLQKTHEIAYERPVTRVGQPEAPIVLVGTGCVTELIEAAVGSDPGRFRGLLLRQLLPLPVAVLQRELTGATLVVMVEYNATGQLEFLLRSVLEDKTVRSLRRYDGEHFVQEEFLEVLEATIAGKEVPSDGHHVTAR